MTRSIAILALLGLQPALAAAEVELSFYGGVQTAQPSDISIRDPLIGDDDFTQSWDGRSFEAPPYYGLRATSWQTANFGFGIDFTHAKVYPEDDQLPAGYEVLEFTDGINTLTVNAYRRWNDALGTMSPYVGGGIGVSVPHVELTNGASETFGYQITGPAATVIAGAQMPINDQWSVFGEYKGTISSNTADLDSGGTLEADVVTNALNVGVSFNF
ncbi:MAG: outer membrane beta-barrel protein [Pseudomonadota bacterium]